MIINHNIPAEFAHRAHWSAGASAAKSAEKLSSGLRINRSADDAAGLAISEKMRGQIRGLKQALRNAMDGISFIQTTEGYLASITESLQRLRELAVQSANGIYTQQDRLAIQVEVDQLVDEVDRVASQAQFNTINMLTGRFKGPTNTDPNENPMIFHIGANMDQREPIHIMNADAETLGIVTVDSKGKNPISLSTIDQANSAIAVFDQAIESVSKQRAALGAYQNRLEFASEAIRIGAENLQASESRIRDTDMAALSTQNARNMILMQSSIAMLAQANLTPQLVLRLLN